MSDNKKLNPKFMELINNVFDNDPEIINKLQQIGHKDVKFVSLMNKLCDGDSINNLKIMDIISNKLEEDERNRNSSIPPQLIKDFLLEAKKLKESSQDSQNKIIIPSNSIALGETIKNIREHSDSEKNIKNINKKI